MNRLHLVSEIYIDVNQLRNFPANLICQCMEYYKRKPHTSIQNGNFAYITGIILSSQPDRCFRKMENEKLIELINAKIHANTNNYKVEDINLLYKLVSITKPQKIYINNHRSVFA